MILPMVSRCAGPVISALMQTWCALTLGLVHFLSKFREQAMLAATSKCNEGQSEYQEFLCHYCTQGYKGTSVLQKL